VFELLRSDKLRTGFLNVTLLLVFACAWVSDQWPKFATAAVALGCALAVFQIALLLNLGKSRNRDAHNEAKVVQTTEIPVSHIAGRSSEVAVIPATALALNEALYSELLHSQSRAVHALKHSHRYKANALVRHAQLLSWTVEHSREDRFKFLMALKGLDRRPSPSELEKWRLVVQGDEAFQIAAGAFEIEHFHGKTNIRVLDTSRVTVETDKRGVPLPDAPPGLAPATYQ
jgi:hypothetical protein